MLASRSH